MKQNRRAMGRAAGQGALRRQKVSKGKSSMEHNGKWFYVPDARAEWIWKLVRVHVINVKVNDLTVHYP